MIQKITKNERGKRAQWRGYLLPLILGLIVLSLVLFFIFREYFTEEDLNWQQCRQSVLVRATAPNIDVVGIDIVELKDKFPLKCQTNVVTIDSEKMEEARAVILDTLAQCWYMFLEGKEQIFPSSALELNSFCVPCARIHFDAKVKDFYGKNEISLLDGMKGQLKNTGLTYEQYLGTAVVGNSVYIKGVSDGDNVAFSISGDKFTIDDEATTGIWDSITSLVDSHQALLNVPDRINSEKGDILIMFNQVVGDANAIDSNIIWFQVGQTNPDPFSELEKSFTEAGVGEANICDEFEGIPA